MQAARPRYCLPCCLQCRVWQAWLLASGTTDILICTAGKHPAGGKGTDIHKAAVIGDTVGDPLKDTSGPSLNILIKLMAVESLVFAPFFQAHTPNGLIFKYFK